MKRQISSLAREVELVVCEAMTRVLVDDQITGAASCRNSHLQFHERGSSPGRRARFAAALRQRPRGILLALLACSFPFLVAAQNPPPVTPAHITALQVQNGS